MAEKQSGGCAVFLPVSVEVGESLLGVHAAGQQLGAERLQKLRNRRSGDPDFGPGNQFFRQKFQQNLFQSVPEDRLGNKGSESGVHQLLTGFQHDIGGESCYGGVEIRKLFQFFQCFQTVHSRHHIVHENQMIGLLLHHGDTFRTGHGSIDLHMGFGKKLEHDLLVGGIVIHNQNMRLRCGKRTEHFVFGVQRHRADLLENFGGKGTAGTEFTLHGHGAVEQFGQTFHNGQPQAGAFDFPQPGGIHPGKSIKQSGNGFLGDTDAGIGYGKGQIDLIFLFTFPAGYGSGNASLFGIFDSIAQKISGNLPQQRHVTVQSRRQVRGDFHMKGQSLLFAAGPADQLQHIGKLRGAIGGIMGFQFSGFDFGDIQHIVYKGQQHLSGVIDFF